MSKETAKPKFPELAKCSYWGEGVCGDVGCVAQALMKNSADLGANDNATKRRSKIEKTAKFSGCPIKLVRPI